MKFEEIRKLEKVFAPYLTYEGINLWKLSETGFYYHFLGSPKERKKNAKIKERLLRPLVKTRDFQRQKEALKSKSKGEVLMIVYDMSHVNSFLPIVKKLKNVKVIRYDLPSTNITGKTLKKNKIPYANLDRYIDKGIRIKIKRAAKWLGEQFEQIKNDESIKKKFNKKEYNALMHGLEYFCKTRKRYLEIIRFIELFDKIYRKDRPKIVIVGDDINPIGRTAALVAKKYKIPSLTVQHGQLQGNPVGEISTDKMAVNGNREKDLLISKGADKKKIVVVGQPRFDPIAKIKLTKEQACKELGLDPNKKRIIFTAQKPSPDENVTQSALKCFVNEIRKLKNKKDIDFIITIRHDMNEKNLPRGVKDMKIRVIKGGDIHRILLAGDIYSTAFSTVAIEAVLLGKPIISINIGKDMGYIDYGKEKVGFTIREKEDFLPKLNKILYDKNFKKKFEKGRQRFIKNYNYRLDGKAIDRIINLIKKNKK